MTTRESGKLCMAKLARIAHRQAEIDAERAQLSAEQAKIYNELADGETVDMTTGKRLAREKQLTFDPVDPETRARALQTLYHHQNRKKLRA
jgi:hypothetical protein